MNRRALWLAAVSGVAGLSLALGVSHWQGSHARPNGAIVRIDPHTGGVLQTVTLTFTAAG